MENDAVCSYVLILKNKDEKQSAFSPILPSLKITKLEEKKLPFSKMQSDTTAALFVSFSFY